MSIPDDLQELLDRVRLIRGKPGEWVNGEMLLSKFITTLGDESRVLCRGEIHHPAGRHYPAVLVYNTTLGQAQAWAPRDAEGIIAYSIDLFYSSIPHESIAREVYLDKEETASIVPSMNKDRDHV